MPRRPQTAEQLAEEALRLAEEGTKESLERAIRKFLAAAPLYGAAGDVGREADSLNSAGTLYSHLGEPIKALEQFTRSLALYREIGDRDGQAVALNNLGSVAQALGQSQNALDCFEQALPHLKAVGNREGEATTLNNIGGLYFLLGEEQRALDFFERSLSLRGAGGDLAAGAVTLTNLGDLQVSRGETRDALECYEQALPLFRAAGDRRGEATALYQIGQLHANAGDLEKAVERYAQALPLSRALGDLDGEAHGLSAVGAGFVALGEHAEALDSYRQVLPLYHALGDRGGAARTLFNIAYNERATGDLDGALVHVEGAIELLESLRADVGSQALRSSYFASVQDYYEFYVDLLMEQHGKQPEQGFAGRALQAAERARARSLLETLAEAGADIRQGVDPALLERERALHRELDAKGREQAALLGGRPGGEAAASLAVDLDTLASALRHVEARIRRASPRYAALTQPRPLTARQIQRRLLDRHTLLLEYSLGRDRSFLWAVTRDSIEAHELSKRAEVEAAARQFHAWLADARTGPSRRRAPAAAKRLAQMLLAPVAGRLAGQRLLVVADGALQYIPFAALPIPSAPGARKAAGYRPLVAAHEIVTLPSASTLAVLRREMKTRKPAAKTLAVFADPVFTLGDARFAAAGKGSTQPDGSAPGAQKPRGPARLPGTRREAERILVLVPGAERAYRFGFAASRAALAELGLEQYRYVHFATHGLLDSRHPELSGLLLSMYDQEGKPQDGFLRAHEVYNLKLSAELVTLSACETGLGKEIRGEGLIGLTRGFLYAGAARVAVSLWPVSDRGTAELMARFYRELLQEGKRPAAALRAAQLSMLEEEELAAPFYWAAFVLQGEFR